MSVFLAAAGRRIGESAKTAIAAAQEEDYAADAACDHSILRLWSRVSRAGDVTMGVDGWE